MVKLTFLKKGTPDFFQTQDLRCSNPLLKKLRKAFCREFFFIQGTAQDIHLLMYNETKVLKNHSHPFKKTCLQESLYQRQSKSILI